MHTKENADVAKQHNARQQKWRQLLSVNFGDDEKLIKKRLRKGVPQSMRTIVWPKLVGLQDYSKKQKFSYESLLKMPSPCQREIGLDIDRTFAEERAAVMRKSLKLVLHALSLAHPGIGYCQGMNTLVMRLLETLTDEATFWMVSYLITMYPLLEMNLKNPRSTELQNYVLERLVQHHLPKIHQVITKQEILYMSFAPRWFLTLLSATLPRETLMRVYDCFLKEGYKIIYRATLAMIKVKEQKILINTYEENQRYISGYAEVYENIAPDEFINIMFGFSMSRTELQNWEVEFLNRNPLFLQKLEQEHQQVEQRRAEEAKSKLESEKKVQPNSKTNLPESQPLKKKPSSEIESMSSTVSNGRAQRPPPEGSRQSKAVGQYGGYQPPVASHNIPALNPYLYIPRPVQIPINSVSSTSIVSNNSTTVPNNATRPQQPVYAPVQQPQAGVYSIPSYMPQPNFYGSSQVFEAPMLPRPSQPSQPINYTNIHAYLRPVLPSSEEQIIEEYPAVQRPQVPNRPFPRYDYYRPY